MASVKQGFGNLDDYMDPKNQPGGPVSTGAQAGAGVQAGASPAQSQGQQPAQSTQQNQQQGNAQTPGTGFVNVQDVYAANKKGADALTQQLNNQATAGNQAALGAYNTAQSNALTGYQNAYNSALNDFAKQKNDYLQNSRDYNNWHQIIHGDEDPGKAYMGFLAKAGGAGTGSLVTNRGTNLAVPSSVTDANSFDTFFNTKPTEPSPFQAPTNNTLSSQMGAGAFGNLQTQLQNAASFDKSLQSPGGISAAIGQYAGAGSPYGYGQQSLDSLLVGMNNNQLQSAAGQYGALMNALGNNSINNIPTNLPTPSPEGYVDNITGRPKLGTPLNPGDVPEKPKKKGGR